MYAGHELAGAGASAGAGAGAGVGATATAPMQFDVSSGSSSPIVVPNHESSSSGSGKEGGGKDDNRSGSSSASATALHVGARPAPSTIDSSGLNLDRDQDRGIGSRDNLVGVKRGRPAVEGSAGRIVEFDHSGTGDGGDVISCRAAGSQPMETSRFVHLQATDSSSSVLPDTSPSHERRIGAHTRVAGNSRKMAMGT